MSTADNAIVGVVIKQLKSFPDGRGFFREIFRANEPIFEGGQFMQWSHSSMVKNVVKAWHYHHVQTDWWYVPLGQVDTVLFDNREESPTYKKKLVIRMGEGNEVCVRIPPGVLHGCKVISEQAHLFYITSETYDPNEEGRFPFNSPLVGHDWGIEPITSEQDRRTFVPVKNRQPLN